MGDQPYQDPPRMAQQMISTPSDAPYGHGLSGVISRAPSSGSHANMSLINVLLDALASDLGRRLESVEMHIIERSNRLEQMLVECDKRWEGIRQASNSGPEQMQRMEESIQLQMEKFRYTLEGTHWQVEQLVAQQPSGTQKENSSNTTQTFGPQKENTSQTGGSKSPASLPSFGDNMARAHGVGADELDGIMTEIVANYAQPDDEWVVHVERHLQQIHQVLEEMSLQHTNLQVKMNTVHNKVSDTHTKMIEDQGQSTFKKSVALTALPVKSAKVLPASPNGAQNTDAPESKLVPKNADPGRHDLVHALHSAMGHKKRQLHPHHGSPGGREHWQEIANNRWFQLMSVVTIILNGLLIGAEQHYEVRYLIQDTLYREGVTTEHPVLTGSAFFRVMDLIFILFWLVEILLHALAQGSHYCEIHNPMFRWNMFDVLCLIVSILQLLADTLLQSIESAPGLGQLRLLRVLRVVRVMRVVKVVKAVQGVRKLVIAVHGALLTLFWALMLLALLLYMFTIMISASLSNHYAAVDIGEVTKRTSASSDQTHTEEVLFYYGGVPSTMATLFQSITGGDWTVMALPVFQISWEFYGIWYGYIAFVLFGLLNVFTGIFVESASFAANSDREIMIQMQMEEENSYLNQIRAIFAKTDTDNSGCMTQKELESLMEKDDFKQQLELLGIHPTEAHGLFKLLDDDASGSVSIEEFVSGCLRLKGTAKAVDMITLLFETNKLNRKISSMKNMLESIGLEGGDDCPSEAGSTKSPRSMTRAGSSDEPLQRTISQVSF